MISRKLGFPFLQAFVFGVFRILLSISFILIWRLLKGQCHKIFDTFLSKNSTWAIYSMNRHKRFREIFCLHKNIHKNSRKNVCPCSRWIRWHGVSVVIDYADTMLAWSLTTQKPCQHSQRLRWHTGNYFTLEKEKTSDKSNKKCNLILSKLLK